MRKLFTLAVLCLMAVSNLFAQAYIDPKLQNAIIDKTKPVQVVVTFKGNGAPSLLDLSVLTQAGIVNGLTLRSLPIAGVVATGLQVDMLAKNSRVLSLYLNESLQSEGNAATALTGVDRLRTEPVFMSRNNGMPLTGKGVGVVVNDSGVDGTHPDLQFGRNLKQNVMAATNLNAVSSLLPYLILENVPNTDATGGHGTHVAGIVGGTGQASQGLYEGVAPGADLIGYGSGAALLLLDVLSGFDYAITNQARYNIRVITNSFGTTSDTGTDVNPADPITLATKRCIDRNIVVVFSAGNSGPGSGTMTGQYKKAPWVIAVAAGDKSGRLASFSSRGIKNKTGSFSLDGKTYTWEDRPTVTSPGVDIIAARAISPTASLSIDKDAQELDPAHVAFYTHMSGTSMAAPHVAGIVALLLEANPTLTPYQVKEILQQTATNIPNREKWEVGAGYVNAYAAVDRAYRATAPYGASLNMNRTFRSSVNTNNVTENFTIDYNPATTATNTYTFNVASGTTAIEAKIRTTGVMGETGNPVNLSLISPSGAETRSGIPVLFALSYDRGVAVASPEAGTWTVRVSGLNGAAFPEKISGVVNLMTAAGTTGLNDIAGHPAEASIKMAVGARLVDGLSGGGYKPDELLKRIDMADYLMMGEAIRQHLPVSGANTLTDVKERNLFAESVVARGAALRDQVQTQNGIMLPASPGKFNPNGKVNRAEVAYSLVQALGLQRFALERNGKTPSVTYNGNSYPITDATAIPEGLEGYVSVALELNLINAYFTSTQGPYDLEPTIQASFKPLQDVTRADFAVIVTRTHGLWNSGQQPLAAESSSNLAIDAAGTLVSYPNPFTDVTTIRYAVEQAGPVRVEVFDIMGRKVRTLVAESKTAGDHAVEFRAENLPTGTYIYKVEANGKVYSSKMLLAK